MNIIDRCARYDPYRDPNGSIGHQLANRLYLLYGNNAFKTPFEKLRNACGEVDSGEKEAGDARKTYINN